VALAARGHLPNAPDTSMDKIAVGPAARGAIDLSRSATWNLKQVARAMKRW
jgi:fructose-1,6-bisphosphatase II